MHLLIDYLTRSFSIPKGNIFSLINEFATRENIISQFRSVLNQNQLVRAGDRIVVYYAGQGTAISPPAVCDAMICPYDMDVGGTADAPNFALHNLLCELMETKGKNIVREPYWTLFHLTFA